ncbi:MAG TPA: PepSY-associated TM helix domain-containing protein [Polyangiales bacterium]
MRRILGQLHRWLGLATALFLFVAGLTGAIIAWDHELDAWLNPELFALPGATAALPSHELARRLEQQEPRLRVRYMPLNVEPEHTLLMFVEGRVDPATKRPYELGYDQVAVDPRNGAILGRRRALSAASLSRAEIIPFLYKLHYTLHLPAVGGFPTGKWLMGLVAIVWFVDGFVALWISFPSWRVWRKSFAFRFRQGAHKLTFDLHRSSGVWAWLLLTVLAFTAISMNLSRELVRPTISLLATLTPTPFDHPPTPRAGDPTLTREQVMELARTHAAALGIRAPLGGVLYSGARHLYLAGFYEPGNEHGDWGLGNARLYFDGDTGELVGKLLPGSGTPGDLFMQAQFPLHSGRILGKPGRILISLLGVVVALLSATGLLLWARKRRAHAQRDAGAPGAAELQPLAVRLNR